MVQEMRWHTLSKEELERELTTGSHGLTASTARARLAQYGPNQLPEAAAPSALLTLLHQFTSPLIYILLASAVATTLLGEYVDASVIGAILIINAIIGFTQERRAESSVRALMGLVSPRARVIRDGRDLEVDGRELVPGDLVLLESGARVPADLRLVATNALTIDESLLTGESLSVRKKAQPVALDAGLIERTDMAFTGAVVTSGRGRGYVVAAGADTELGRIAGSMREEKTTAGPLEQRMSRFARVIGLVVTASAAAGFVIGLLQGESAVEMFMVAVALAVAAVPEGLPIVLTITLAVGVRRMARRQAIIRNLPAIEALGSTTVIGSDKTGTLTENRMTVQEIWTASGRYPLGEAGGGAELLGEHRPLYLALLAGVLTNEAEVYTHEDGRVESRGDPTEAALLLVADRLGFSHEVTRAELPTLGELPFEPERKYSASVRVYEGRHVTFAKGAPEKLLGMCRDMLADHAEVPLDPDRVHEAASALASKGLRVLALAWGEAPGELGEELREPANLTLLGLVGMMDPPRAGVREAIAGCARSGIRVVMITGDHAATARAIGGQLGLSGPDAEVLTGADLEEMDEDALLRRVPEVSLYARVAPEQKLRIVRALQRQGEVVAVTGDGVNDAPALKAGDVGVAMGRSGTDVAREAADMLLTDDNFISIYAAVEEGRITFENLRKATFFLVSTGVASIITILVALGLGWPLPLLPAQLLWLNLVTNGLQDVALAFEPGEPGGLDRRPRGRGEGFISGFLWQRTALAGLVIAAGTLYVFWWELERTASLPAAQTAALTTMVIFQMLQVGNARSETQSVFRMSPFSNPFLLVATVAALVVHVAALFLAPTQFVLRVVPLEGVGLWMRIVGVAATILAAMELHKAWRRRAPPARHPPLHR